VKETRLEWHVRVPIVILDFLPPATPSGDKFPPIQVDVSVGDMDSSGVRKGHVDRLIQGALSRSPKAACLVLLVKRWAKIEELNKSFEGHLSPLAWTLLCLYFLVVTDRLEQNALTASGWDVPSPPSAQLCESCVSHEELAEFFDMVAGFQKFLESRETGKGPMGIRLMPDCRALNGRPDDLAFFFLEDPAARAVSISGVNVARGVKSREKWLHLLSRCQGAAKALRAGANPADFFARRLAAGSPKSTLRSKARPMAKNRTPTHPAESSEMPAASSERAEAKPATPLLGRREGSTPFTVPPRSRPPIGASTRKRPMAEAAAAPAIGAKRSGYPLAAPQNSWAKWAVRPKARPKEVPQPGVLAEDAPPPSRPSKVQKALPQRQMAPLRPGYDHPVANPAAFLGHYGGLTHPHAPPWRPQPQVPNVSPWPYTVPPRDKASERETGGRRQRDMRDLRRPAEPRFPPRKGGKTTGRRMTWNV